MDKTAADRWLEQAVQTHGDSLLRLCFLYLHDRQLAEDAVQETFIRAWRAYGGFRQDSRDKTWLTRIAVNVCKSALRRERPLSLLDAPEGSYEAQFRDDTVLQAVCALPQKLREVVLLYYFQELSTPEIAKMLHLPRNVITARLSRARTQLKTDLKGWYFNEPAETASE